MRIPKLDSTLSLIAQPLAIAMLAALSQACVGGESAVDPDATPSAPSVDASDPPVDTTIVLRDQARPSEVASDQSHLYWLNRGLPDLLGNPASGEILRMPLGGGASEVVATGLSQSHDLVVGENSVYWIEFGPSGGSVNGSVWSAPKDGSQSPTALITELEGIRCLAVREGRVYWSQGDPSEIASAATNGTDIQSLAQAGDDVFALLATDSYVYWSDMNDIARVPIGGGAVEAFASVATEGAAYPQRSGEDLYYVSDRGDLKVSKTNLLTNARITIAFEEGVVATGLAITDTAAYYSAGSGTTWSIRTASLEPAGHTLLWSGGFIVGPVVGSENVYWVSPGDDDAATGTVHMLAL